MPTSPATHDASAVDGRQSKPKDRRVQKLKPNTFPILQGLTDTNKKLSPLLFESSLPAQPPVTSQRSSAPHRNQDGLFSYPGEPAKATACDTEIPPLSDEQQTGNSDFTSVNTSASDGTLRSTRADTNVNQVSPPESAILKAQHRDVIAGDGDSLPVDVIAHGSDSSIINHAQKSSQSSPQMEVIVGDRDPSQTNDAIAHGRDSPRGEGEGSADEPAAATCAESPDSAVSAKDDAVKASAHASSESHAQACVNSD